MHSRTGGLGAEKRLRLAAWVAAVPGEPCGGGPGVAGRQSVDSPPLSRTRWPVPHTTTHGGDGGAPGSCGGDDGPPQQRNGQRLPPEHPGLRRRQQPLPPPGDDGR